jgi:DNA primase
MKTLVNNQSQIEGLDAYDVLVNVIGAKNIIMSGEELIHSCPLPFGNHKNGDSNPSASLNRETLLFNCFTCGGGSIIWLVQNCMGVTRDESLSILKKEITGLKLVSQDEFVSKLEKTFNNDKIKTDEIHYYSENILKRWQGESDYLTARGVSIRVQQQMRTGTETGRLEIARVSGREEMVPVDRVVIPHFIKGRLVGWVARRLHDMDGVPKYRNSKGFPRGAWLYNLDDARSCKEIYVVESPMSVLVLKSRGINNVVATFGAKVDNNQMELLRNFSHVITFMDGDTAGRLATNHLVESLSRYTSVSVIDTPDDEDPATLLQIPIASASFAWQLLNR